MRLISFAELFRTVPHLELFYTVENRGTAHIHVPCTSLNADTFESASLELPTPRTICTYISLPTSYRLPPTYSIFLHAWPVAEVPITSLWGWLCSLSSSCLQSDGYRRVPSAEMLRGIEPSLEACTRCMQPAADSLNHAFDEDTREESDWMSI